MSGVAYSAFKVGAVTQPLSTASANTLLQDADPALYLLLDFCTYIINTFPGPRLLQAATAAGLGSGPNAITAAVAQAYPYIPKPWLAENQYQFPLLAIYRTRRQTGRLAAGHEHDRGYFELVYALPPLTSAQAEQIIPALNAVYQALRLKVTQGWDPGYTPPFAGAAVGQQPMWLPYGGVENIGFGDPYRDYSDASEDGGLEGVGNLLFPSIKLKGFITERDNYLSLGVKYAGADITANLIATDGTTAAAPFVQVSTQLAPTLASLSASSGTHLGGTAVTLTGTLFLSSGQGLIPGQGPVVMFGPNPATSVVWVNSTTITCVTPASSGAGSVTVVVLNRDGQAATLANAFTYT
jgi:hypothetical protein